MRLTNKGLTLVEVLIALAILTIVIVTLNAIFKQYAAYRQKQARYEDIFISALSLQDRLDDMDLGRTPHMDGQINGLPYSIEIRPVAQKRNFTYGETRKTSGNRGRFLVILYRVTMEIGKRKIQFYKTQYHLFR